MPLTENGQHFRWSYPSDWLNDTVTEAVDRHDIAELVSIINGLIPMLPEDDIQDLFQNEMDADGYFRSTTASAGDTDNDDHES